ncbi:MAG: DOPA 4,5-dioxygenase family protein [Alphaproteobacteria bacterium]
MTGIDGFHAHVYFSEETAEQARLLCEAARDRFGAVMGRMHRRPVGPHPVWSCQLAFPPALFGTLVPWLALNRDRLVVFVHPETGDALADHTRHALWMGQMLPLDLAALQPADG